MKRFLAVLLCVCLLAQTVGALGVVAEASVYNTDQTCGDAVYWDLTDGVLTISGTGDMANYTYFGEQPPWLPYAGDVYRVVIEEGVTSIGQCAFSSDSYSGENCEFSNLTEVEIADTVTMIRMNAFAECMALESITIPASVTTIESAAFVNCTAMKGFEVDENNPAYKAIAGALFTKDGSTLVAYPIGSPAPEYYMPESTRTVAPYAVSLGANLKEVYFNEGLVFIDDEAFLGCTGLTKVELPDSLKMLGGGVFQECTALYDISLPKTIEKINAQVFTGTAYYNDRSNWDDDVLYLDHALLTGTYLYDDIVNNDFVVIEKSGTLTVKDGTTIIAAEAFFLTSVTEVHFPETLLYIGDGAFYAGDLTEVTLPDSLLVLEDSAFHSCEALLDVHMGPNLQRIGSGVFNETAYTENDDNYTDGVLYHGAYLLDYNTSLPDDVIIREGTTLMAEQAFFHESGYIRENYGSDLKTVTIPESLTTISYRAFLDCNSLTQVTIPETVTEIHEQAFGYDWSYDYEIDRSVFTPRSDFSIVCYPDSAGEQYAIDNGFAYEYAVPKAEEFIYTIENGQATIADYIGAGGDVVIPSTLGGYPVTEIGEDAFLHCSSLTSITIPDGVTSIGGGAFYWCSSLTSITIPDSVTSIGNQAFCECSSLASITIPDGVTSIGAFAFSGCSSLTSIAIPDSVTWIGAGIFERCDSLTSITVGDKNPVYHSVGNCLIDTANELLVAGCGTSVIPVDGSVTSIGNIAFWGCNSLTSITIPDSVRHIFEGAFSYCSNLSSITIPDSVMRIWEDAFTGCSALTDVWYGGTEADRAAMSIDNYNDYLLSATWHYNDEVTEPDLPTEPDEPVEPDDPVIDENAPTFVVDGATAKAGDTVTVAIRTQNNPGITSLKLLVEYDSDVLELTGIEQQEFVGGVFGTSPLTDNPFTINWTDTLKPNNTTDGVVALLTFTVKEGAVAGDTTISLSYDPEDVFDESYENVTFATAEGTVSIVEYISGDATGDGSINNKDLGLLLQYLNGWDAPVVELACDVNRDGAVNNKDYGLLLRYLNGWDVELK